MMEEDDTKAGLLQELIEKLMEMPGAKDDSSEEDQHTMPDGSKMSDADMHDPHAKLAMVDISKGGDDGDGDEGKEDLLQKLGMDKSHMAAHGGMIGAKGVKSAPGLGGVPGLSGMPKQSSPQDNMNSPLSQEDFMAMKRKHMGL